MEKEKEVQKEELEGITKVGTGRGRACGAGVTDQLLKNDQGEGRKEWAREVVGNMKGGIEGSS